MTIVTKANTEKKTADGLQKPLVVADGTVIDCETEGGITEASPEEVEAWLSASTRRRVSTTTTVCVFITALVVMSLGIIGGVYLYRQFSEHQMARFQGWCGVPYKKSSFNHLFHNDKLLGPNKSIFKDDSSSMWMKDEIPYLFKEEFDLDLENDMHVTIVPKFGIPSSQGMFYHDFKVNKTFIVDMNKTECYILDLDRTHISSPKMLFQVVRKMWMGYYNFDHKVIHTAHKIIRDKVDANDKILHHNFLKAHCHNKSTYNAILLDSKRQKRSLAEGLEPRFVSAEFAGKNIVEVSIYGPDDEGKE